MLLYKCTSCQEVIEATKARLTCSTCSPPPIILCTNCYVVQDYPPQHPDGASHSFSVYQHSGYLPVPPPRVRTQSIGGMYKAAPAPPQRRPVPTVPDTEVPPRKPPRPSKQPEVEPEPGAGEQASIPLPPGSQQQGTEKDREQQQQQPQQPQQQYQPSGWTYFFNQDMKPTPCFSALIKEFFYHLDPKRTSLLSPETCSEYIDACGAALSHNIC